MTMDPRPAPPGDDVHAAMASLRPQTTIVEQAYHSILDAICDGRLEPGERLTQESVAKKLSVSRQPVGQALLLLKQQKFVCDAGRRGLMVAPLDRDFLRWVYELRLGIDPLACALAARRATPAAIARGERIVAAGQRAVREGSLAKLVGADMDFHMHIYELSGNRLFVDTMGQLWNHLRRAMREVLQHRDYRKTIWTEHEQILRAIAAGNADGAADLARAHLRSAAVGVEVVLLSTPAADAGHARGR
jgi:DNA-binding GntR family transcriptional regulator